MNSKEFMLATLEEQAKRIEALEAEIKEGAQWLDRKQNRIESLEAEYSDYRLSATKRLDRCGKDYAELQSRIKELTSALYKCVGAVIHTDSDRAVAEIVHKALGGE